MKCHIVIVLFVVCGYFGVGIGTALGFTESLHAYMTRDRLKQITAEVNGEAKNFSSVAIDELVESNLRMDANPNWGLVHPEFHFLNESFTASTKRLMEKIDTIVESLEGSPPNGDQARRHLGEELHLIQDFYAHSNWIELGNNQKNDLLGRVVMANPSNSSTPCQINPSTLEDGTGQSLTSGYFIYDNRFAVPFGCGNTPEGKCAHGNYLPTCRGINKDHRGDSPAAENQARQSTTDYVDLVLSRIKGNDDAIRALLDLRGTIGFVIDDTGSMGTEINGVKTTVSKLVNVVNDDPDKKPDNWVLVRYGDPDVGSAFVTDDAEDLLNSVNALSPNGGGDCPELSQKALLTAIDAAYSDSHLFLFSDASAKDSKLQNAVISKAQEKNIKLEYAITGSCSPIDNAYVRGAYETGGQLFFISPSEIPLLFDLFEPLLSGDLQTIISTNGQALGTPISFDIPVDSTMSRLIVSVSIDTKTSSLLRRPSGEIVNDSDPDAQITHLSSGCIITIDTPAPGLWLVETTGFGRFSIVAEGNSPIEFRRFAFVEPNEDIHGGYFPVPGQPLAGAESTGKATLLGPFFSATFELVHSDGETIQNIILNQGFPDADPGKFLGVFTLPDQPFVVAVRGTDVDGNIFRRQFSSLFRAQTLGVDVSAVSDNMVPVGVPTSFDFTVMNLGPTATFLIEAVDNLGSVSSVYPSVLSLESGASESVQVEVIVPQGTPNGSNLALTVTATKQEDASIFNSTTLDLIVKGDNDPPDCASASDLKIGLWPPNHKFVSIDILSMTGITDSDGDPVTIVVDSITQDEPVYGTDDGDGNTGPDAIGIGTGIVEIRAEREGSGNGRVYKVDFTASDDSGATCQGIISVIVPHDTGNVSEVIDDGQVFNSSGL